MKSRPSLPDVAAVRDELLGGGHLWLQEYVDGDHLRFRLRDDGAIRFGDEETAFRPGDAPLRYRHALRHVRERLDRDALRAAVDDVGSVTFFGVATQRRVVKYDWARTPSFLGTDVWSASEEAFLPPDRVEQVFGRLGLVPINAVRKELRAQDFDPDAYDFPASNWYDGPVAGVVARNKTGDAATLLAPWFEADEGATQVAKEAAAQPDSTPKSLADRYATDRRLERLARGLEERGRAVTAEALLGRALEAVAREAPRRPFRDGDVDAGALRSALAPRVRAFLDGRDWE